MARTWLNDGKPLADGRFCLVIDPEDGTQPLRVWGHTKDEVLDKTAKTVEHGARTIHTLRSQISSTSPTSSLPRTAATAAPETAATERPPTTRLTAGEQIQLTADLSIPSKAPAAVTRLVEHHTGIQFDKIHQQETVERIATIQANWSYSHPDFPKHPINYKLLNDAATIRAGGYENITSAIMDQVFIELSTAGLLVDADDEEPPATPTVLPEENPATRTVRLRGAASHRRTVTSPAPPAASPTPKYTRAQIEAMTSDEYRRKLETDPEFGISVAALAGTPTGNA